MNERIEIGALIARSGHVASRALVAVAMYFLAMVLLNTALDYYLSESLGFGLLGYLFLSGAVTLIAGYLLMQALMRSSGLTGGVAGLGSYLGLSIIIGIATGIGFLLLVVPGILLTVRWLPAYAILLAGDEGAVDAPGASWDLTRGHFGPLLAAFLIGFAPAMAIVIGLGAAEGYAVESSLEGPLYVASLALNNAVVSALTIYISALGIAAYVELRGDRIEAAEVFA